MNIPKIGFIGAGRIVRIFLQALYNAGQRPKAIVLYDPDDSVLQRLESDYSNLPFQRGTLQQAASREWVFFAVHPPVLKSVLPEIRKPIQSATADISLAPVLKSSFLIESLQGYDQIIRVIPNAASYMNTGTNPVWYAPTLSTDVKSSVAKFLQLLGDAPEVDEEKLEGYAIITAMGSTYFWPQLQALVELSQEFGWEAGESNAAVESMMQDTIEMFFHSGLDYSSMTDLIPVKPLAEHESAMCEPYKTTLSRLYKKLTGK